MQVPNLKDDCYGCGNLYGFVMAPRCRFGKNPLRRLNDKCPYCDPIIKPESDANTLAKQAELRRERMIACERDMNMLAQWYRDMDARATKDAVDEVMEQMQNS